LYTNKKFFSTLMVIILFNLLLASVSLSDQKVIRPPFEKIHTLIVGEGCFIKKKAREKLALTIKKLDEIHSSYLERSGYSFLSPANFVVQMKEKTTILPSRVPLCERAIVFSLLIQIEMLDQILTKKDHEKALFLVEKRKRKKLLSKSKKIYGDYRDVYFFLIIDLLGDISELHHCFGIGGDLNFEFPAGINQTEVDAYILTKIKFVSRNAEKLLGQK